MVIDTSDTLVAWVLYLPEHPVIDLFTTTAEFISQNWLVKNLAGKLAFQVLLGMEPSCWALSCWNSLG